MNPAQLAAAKKFHSGVLAALEAGVSADDLAGELDISSPAVSKLLAEVLAQQELAAVCQRLDLGPAQARVKGTRQAAWLQSMLSKNVPLPTPSSRYRRQYSDGRERFERTIFNLGYTLVDDDGRLLITDFEPEDAELHRLALMMFDLLYRKGLPTPIDLQFVRKLRDSGPDCTEVALGLLRSGAMRGRSLSDLVTASAGCLA
jgi:hypothetical protein